MEARQPRFTYTGIMTFIGRPAGLALAAGIACAAFGLGAPGEARRPSPEERAVAGPGRIEPEDGVIRINAPYFAGGPAIVGEVKVREGEDVQAGQILATLQGREQMAAGLRHGEANSALARSRLQQVMSGAKTAEVAAQQAEIARLELVLANERAESERYGKLLQSRHVSDSAADAKRTAAAAAAQSLQAAKAKLRSLNEVRQADIEVARAEVRLAEAAVERARQDFALTQVLAPAAGRILKIRAHAGEVVGGEGLLELAKTARMYAIAEIDETEVRRVHVGQRAVVSGDALPAALGGWVEQVSSSVVRSEILPSDPKAFSDLRVAAVKVRLDDGREVASLIHARVSVAFRP